MHRGSMSRAWTELHVQHVALHCREGELVVERTCRIFCFSLPSATSLMCPNISLY